MWFRGLRFYEFTFANYNNSEKEIFTYQNAKDNFNQKETEHSKAVYLKTFN